MYALAEKKNELTGLPWVNTVKVGQCDECVELDRECTHFQLPFWMNAGNKAKQRDFMSDDLETFEIETNGRWKKADGFDFPKEFIHHLRDSAVHTFHEDVPVIHIGVDPGGGVGKSDFALVSIAKEFEFTVVSTTNNCSSPQTRQTP